MKYSTPSKEGMNPRSIIKFLDELEKENIELHGLVIIKNGKVVTKGWWSPYAENSLHQLCSCTKTFTCMAIGFAIDEGLISVNDTLYKFFPEKFPENADERTKSINIHHLLTMTSGLKTEAAISAEADAVRAFASCEQEFNPGENFKYNSLGSHMLSEILYKVTGKQVSEYLTPRLFKPLGIENYKWLKTPQGIEFGGSGLHISTMDLAKAGQLFLQNGMWNGKRVLPKFWADEATKYQVESVPEGEEWIDWAKGYCYQMWCGMQEGSYRLDGAFGQYALVYPSENMVIALHAANNKRPLTMRILDKYLFDKTNKKDSVGDKLLAEKTANLSVGKDALKVKRSETECKINYTTYNIEENDLGIVPLSERWFVFEKNAQIEFVHFEFMENHLKLVISDAGRISAIDVGLDGQYRQSTHRSSCCDRPLLSAGYWENDDCLYITIRSIEEITALHIRFTFEENSVKISLSETIDAFNPKYTILSGHANKKVELKKSEITFDN